MRGRVCSDIYHIVLVVVVAVLGSHCLQLNHVQNYLHTYIRGRMDIAKNLHSDGVLDALARPAYGIRCKDGALRIGRGVDALFADRVPIPVAPGPRDVDARQNNRHSGK